MLNREQADAFGGRFRQFANDPQLQSRLAESAVMVHLAPGHTICHEGDSCTHLALVISGAARVYKLAESGREITLYRVEAGECCILTASCMLSGRHFPANATVETALEAVLISAPHVTRWMGQSEAWRGFLWNLLAERLGDVIGLVEEVAFRRMDQRLTEYLVEQGREKGGVLQVTHQQIAADLGTSREVVSRVLKDLEQHHLLRLSRGRIELDDADALSRFNRLCD